MGSRNFVEGTWRWVLKLEFVRQKRKKWDFKRGSSGKQKEIILSPRRECGNKL